MIRHCDGECGKHDCYVAFLESRLTEVERERDEARAENAAWRKATERDDPEALDFYLGRAGLDSHLKVLTELMTKAEAQRDEARAELAFVKDEYEKANASDLTRDALALQNASLLHKAENYNGLVDALKVSEDENKKLIAALNKARADAIMLRDALGKYFKPSLPYAQWSNEEHQVKIVLDKTEQYK